MSLKKTRIVIIFSVVLLSVFIFANLALQKGPSYSKSNPLEIRWIIAHDPISVFERSAKVFKNRIEAESEGLIKVKIMTYSDFKDGKPNPGSFIKDLRSGKVQMSQVYTNNLVQYEEAYQLIEMPFLFESHEHVKKVFDGEIGKSLLGSLASYSLKGLSFTYSGGFKVIVTNEKGIGGLEDFDKLKLRPWAGRITKKGLSKVVGQITPRSHTVLLEEMLANGQANSGEATFATMQWTDTENPPLKTVLETNHSLFLTTLVMNLDFFNSLPVNLQDIVQSAAIEAALVERQTSIADGQKIKKQLLAKNTVKIRSLTPSEISQWKKKVEPLYQSFEGTRMGDYIEKIKALREPSG